MLAPGGALTGVVNARRPISRLTATDVEKYRLQKTRSKLRSTELQRIIEPHEREALLPHGAEARTK